MNTSRDRSLFDGEPVPSLGADVEIENAFYFVDRYESQHFWPAAKLVEHTICYTHKLVFIP